jgi:hypothetical protein
MVMAWLYLLYRPRAKRRIILPPGRLIPFIGLPIAGEKSLLAAGKGQGFHTILSKFDTRSTKSEEFSSDPWDESA